MDDRSFFIISLIVLVLMTAFAWTIFSTLQKIPKEDRVFPNWFVWFFLIPIIGFIFQWIMLPFGIPMALKNTFKKNQNAIASANMLFGLGIAQVGIASIGLMFHKPPVSEIFAASGILLWIAYWVTITRFKKKYLS